MNRPTTATASIPELVSDSNVNLIHINHLDNAKLCVGVFADDLYTMKYNVNSHDTRSVSADLRIESKYYAVNVYLKKNNNYDTILHQSYLITYLVNVDNRILFTHYSFSVSKSTLS